MNNGTKISDMDPAAIPTEAFVPFIVTAPEGGLTPAENYRADIGGALAAKASLAQLAADGGAALIGTAEGDNVQAELDALQNGVGLTQATGPYVRGILATGSAILFLGDSIGEGTGASTYDDGYFSQVAHSVLNYNDRGQDENAGYGYQVIPNANDIIADGNISTTGAIIDPADAVVPRIELNNGESITISGRTIAVADVIYDGALTSGNLVFALNGTTYATKAVSDPGFSTTFPTYINDTVLCRATDVITITASGGTATITGLLLLRETSTVPLVYAVAKGGAGYQDFISSAKLNELAYYLNLFRADDNKVMVLCLGTNDIYAPAKAVPPATMIGYIEMLIAGIANLCSNMNFVIQVPPQADEDIWPVVLDYTYQDYVDAILTYAAANGYGVIRQDLYSLEGKLADGIHPDNAGHLQMANVVTQTMGILYNPFEKMIPDYSSGQVTFAANWGEFSSVDCYAHRVGNTVSLSGVAAPGMGAGTTACTLPVAYRPIGRAAFVVSQDDAAIARWTINTNGTCVLASSIPSTWVALDGITFQVDRP